MDYETYRANFLVDPAPEQRFAFEGGVWATLYFEDYEAAIRYYTQVLGPPSYVEGEGTRGWRIGSAWLTLLQGKAGNPENIELNFVMDSPAEAERLQAAFVEAGGTGSQPSDQLMYVPVRMCPVVDPFGTEIIVTSVISELSD
jgi:hypothetical protein